MARRRSVQLGVRDIEVRGHVLEQLAAELGRLAARTADTHVKNSGTDLHGKGSHIKGAGPNYLKAKTLAVEHLSDPEVERFIDAVATRVAEKLRQR